MRIISVAPLREFWEMHSQAEQPLKSWIDEVTSASWKTPQDIKDRFSTASFVEKNRVVFNIKGNTYRLIVSVAYKYAAVYIKFVGTHAEYDKVDANKV